MRLSPLTVVSCATVLALCADASAQADLQPGRNFPTAAAAFGTGRSENVDVGDIDNDGDYDAVVANGGDGTAQANGIYINNGGAQGGVVGTFSDQSATRFAGAPLDTSRDIELADFEDDGDLDIYISNRGTTTNGGEVSRAFGNRGGLQFGPVGFYLEVTNTFWGNLVSVPLSDEQGTQDGKGPWRDYSCDCDFGDLDDDGDVDLFHSSYGPNIGGDRDSRIFLNNGQGVFDELWPWVDPGADIQLHTLDIDLIDLDDDYDMDIFASSRDSQARVYRSNLYGGTGAGALYTDVTQTALLNQGAVLNGSNNYEAEPGDVDGDGDMDIYMKNYDGGGGGNFDRVLRNNGNFTFTKMDGWIKGDPNVDENEIDFLDYDSDGDLDAFLANFSGENWLYQNMLADGVNYGSLGLFHRNGTATGGSLASWPELPAANNGGTTLDGECADMDNDGDTDILVANDGNQQNRYCANVLGVPDTHAPVFHLISTVGNKSDNTDTVIHVVLRDNASFYILPYYDVDLLYSVNGGIATRVKMFAQGGMLFRGVIPAAVNGNVSWHVEATDDAGNTAVSPTFAYTQTSTVTSLWQNLGSGTQGVAGDPYLIGRGDQTAGATTSIGLIDAAPNALNALFIAGASSAVPFKGGILYAFPAAITLSLTTNAAGMTWFQLAWPGGVPAGVSLWWQYAIQDAANPTGIAISNAIQSTTP